MRRQGSEIERWLRGAVAPVGFGDITSWSATATNEAEDSVTLGRLEDLPPANPGGIIVAASIVYSL